MNLRQLEVFVRVAELGSFSKAAVVLGVAQPALSRQVRQLETGLRQSLLLRTGRGVTLTEAGKRLFEHSVGILQLVERAREDVEASRGEPLGRVVVGLPPSMGRLLAVDLVERFRERLPRARLAIVEGLSAHITEWIATGRVDVGLLLNPEPGGAIEIVPVLDEPLCLVGTPALPERGPMPFAQLCAHPLIIPERSHAIRRLLEAQAALSGVKLEIACEVSSVPAILDLVRRGHGCAVLAESALGAVAREFVARPIVEPRLATTLCLATSASKPATPLIKRTTALRRELVLAPVPGGRRRPATRARAR
ncbi:MAG: LysR family transcriptional regulator [Burkholderiaceae bacterium]